ncbi:EamA family transporter [Pseudonocardia sp. N23]|uniref:EamA family transporter n=1 Tax=Pseudonocardia sp. N23 TaxID=1987376 RepID=UPI000BFCE124|nr:EamA family transporter [Pseudonocardia sp. N23]GAY09523.1 permease of the drug [Pseudonocardia sp. N23]
MTPRDRLLAAFVAVLWGVNFLAIHIGLGHFPPLLLACLRFTLIAVPTIMFVPRPAVPLRWFLGYALGFGTLQFVFLFVAIDVGMPTGLASLVLQSSAPLTVVLGTLLLRERPSRRQVAGIVAAAAGLTAIAVSQAQVAALVPVLLTLLAGLSWALGNLCGRLAAPPDPMRLTLWMCVVPPVPLLALSLLTEGPAADLEALRTAFTPSGWAGIGAIVYLAVFATVMGTGIWTALMRRYPAGVVAPYSMLVPIVGISTAALVLGERPGIVELVGGAVVVGGVLLGSMRPAAQAGSPLAPTAPAGPGPASDPARTALSRN